VEIPKAYPLVSIFYLLPTFVLLFVLLLSIYKIEETPNGTVVMSNVMSKAETRIADQPDTGSTVVVFVE